MSFTIINRSGPLSAYFSGNIGTVVCSDDGGELLFDRTAHGKEDGDLIEFTAGTMPTNISEGVKYYVIDKTADTFKVALTAGEAAVAKGASLGVDVIITACLRLLGYGTFNLKQIKVKLGDAGGGESALSTSENCSLRQIRAQGASFRDLRFEKDFFSDGANNGERSDCGRLGEEDRLMLDFANTDANIVNVFVELE